MSQRIRLEDNLNLPAGAMCTLVRLPVLEAECLHGCLSSPVLDQSAGWFDWRGLTDLYERVDEVCEHTDFGDDDVLVLVVMSPAQGNSPLPQILLATVNLDDAGSSSDGSASGEYEGEESGEYGSGEYGSGEYDGAGSGSGEYAYDEDELEAEDDEDLESDDEHSGRQRPVSSWGDGPERLD